MIFEEEVPVFPSGVLLEGSWILDTVTGDRVEINETARRMLSLVDGRRPAREIGGAVAASYGLDPPRRVVSDFMQLAALLNEKYLLNIVTPPGSWLVVLPQRVKLFLMGVALGHLSLPSHRKRLDLCNKSRPIAFLTVARRMGLPATVIGGILSLSVWLLLGDVLASWTVVSIALAFALSLVLHEAAHAMALVPVPAFLSVHGPIFLVGHPRIPAGKGFLVAAAGPAITGLSGLLVVLLSGLLNSENMVYAGEILALNLLGVTAIAADGRKASRNLALVLEPLERGGVQC